MIVWSVVITAIAVSVGICSYVVLRNVFIQRTYTQLESISNIKESTLKTFITQISKEIKFATEDEDLYKYLDLYLEFQNVENKRTALRMLSSIIRVTDSFESVYMTNMSGEIILSTNPSDEGKIRSFEPFFVNIGDDVYIQDFAYDTTIQKPVMLVAVALNDQNKNKIGIIVGRVNSEQINQLMIDRSGLGNTGETYIVNSSNVAVSDLLKAPGEVFKKTIFLPQINDCLNGKNSLRTAVDYNNDTVIGYWNWVPEIKSCLVTKIDTSEALESIQTFVRILLLIIVVIGVVSGVFGFVGSSYLISKPINELYKVTNRVKEGDLDVRAEVKSKDEIGDLALAFNEMTNRLKTSYQELEQRVDERTSSLNQKVIQIENQNRALEETKRAVINILEDEKLLEDELKTEKEGVEIKIGERTKELAEEQARLKASIDSLSTGYVMVTKMGGVYICNNAALGILGVTENGGLLLKLSQILKNIGIELSDVMAGEGNLSSGYYETKEILVENKYIRLTLAPIVIEKDPREFVGVVFLIGDVTQQKALERSRDEFFSIASHELRTPLTAIRGNTAMIKDFYVDKLPDQEVKEMIDDIHQASVRLIGIVNDFLDLSRLEQGKIKFVQEAFDLREVLTQAASEVSSLSKTKGVDMIVKPYGSEAKTKADPDRTRQVVVNLLGNALKFTERGSITLVIEDKGMEFEVRIQDTGSGIPPETQGLLFRKFQQAGENIFTRDAAGGTGLGLYISKLLVEGMGGKIYLASSEKGKGSTFAFTLLKA